MKPNLAGSWLADILARACLLLSAAVLAWLITAGIVIIIAFMLDFGHKLLIWLDGLR